MTSVLVYKYGIPTRAWDNTFIQIADKKTGGVRHVRNMPWVTVPWEVKTQLWLGHRLRESFVDLESQFEKDCEQAWCDQVPEIKAAVAELADIAEQIEVQVKAARMEKLQTRSASAKPATIAALKELYAQESAQRKIIKAAKAIKANRTATTPGLKAADDARKAGWKTLYGQFCTEGILPRYCNECKHAEPSINENGVCTACHFLYSPERLYWATYNKVLAQHKTAAQRIRASWKEGKLARFRHHGYDGTGRIAVQLQREHGPVCRCETCVTTALKPWRVTSATEGKSITVAKKATLRGRNKDEEVVIVQSLEAVTAFLASKADCPLAAINLKANENPDAEGHMVWTPVVVADQLDPTQGPKDPVRSGAVLALETNENKWRNVFRLTPHMTQEEHRKLRLRERKVHGRVRFTLGAGRAVELPVTIHRMIPEDADVLEAQLVVRRIGRHFRMHICVTIEIPDRVPEKKGPKVALHIGWRQNEDGDIRVATWGSTAPIAVPPWLTSVHVAPGVTRCLVTRNQSGRSGEIIYPKEWLARADKIASLHSIRARHFDATLKQVASWLDEAGSLPAYRGRQEVTSAGVKQWRSINRLLTLTEELERRQPDAGILPALREWRDGTGPGPDDFHGDLHLADYAAHDEEQLLGRRDYLYHVIAAWFAKVAREMVIDDINLAALRQGPANEVKAAEERESMPAQIARQTRSNAKAASSGQLRQLVATAAKRDGVKLTVTSVVGFGRTCPSCDHVADKDDPRWSAAATVVCDNCGRSFDQDRATIRKMLLEPVAPVVPTQPIGELVDA